MKTLITIGLVCGLVFAAFAADAKGLTKQIKFSRGASETAVEDCVLLSERNTYTLDAKAGQTMTVKIKAEEDNAVFEIYKPGGKSAYPKAGEQDDTTSWTGTLTDSGKQSIIVGGTRGNACYRLTVGIK